MQAVERFIEQIANHAEADGLPRIAGRIMAYFVIHGGPFSFSEVAERLAISRGSASTNTRLLRDLGILERYQKPGSRQDYFRLGASPYQRLLRGYIERMETSISNIDNLLAEASEALDADARTRLGDLNKFYATAVDMTQRTLEATKEN